MGFQTGFFGRRKGRVLSQTQKKDLSKGLDQYGLDLSFSAPIKIQEIFHDSVLGVRLEIGFGKGEHLLYSIKNIPQEGVIGVEPFVNGFAKLVSALIKEPSYNVRVYNGHASEILDWIPESSLSGVDLFYPDPWTKRKHWKRRFVNQKNLISIARVLKKGGLFRFASDIEDYVDWTICESQKNQLFQYMEHTKEDSQIPFEGWVPTAYEKKALHAGRRSFYLSFQKQ